jgi:hypothetical protein
MHKDLAATRAAFRAWHESRTEGRPGDPAGAWLPVLLAPATHARAGDGLSHGTPPVQMATVAAETQLDSKEQSARYGICRYRTLQDSGCRCRQ